MPVFFQMLSKTEAEQLVADARGQRYEDKLHGWTYMKICKDILRVHGVRRRALALLGTMVKEASEDLKLHQGSMVKADEQELELHQDANGLRQI